MNFIIINKQTYQHLHLENLFTIFLMNFIGFVWLYLLKWNKNIYLYFSICLSIFSVNLISINRCNWKWFFWDLFKIAIHFGREGTKSQIILWTANLINILVKCSIILIFAYEGKSYCKKPFSLYISYRRIDKLHW